MNLVIVESPNKCKTIQEILKKAPGQWRVSASAGHIRDLPEREIGVEPPKFIPHYEIVPDVVINGKKYSKRETVARLKKEAHEADVVYLATDPDREGESIAWHLQEALGLKSPKRITFNEVTETAVLSAIKNPRQIDMRLVSAQEARRVLDRLVGYKCSGPVSKLSGEQGSAGRVQSPALRLLVEREEAIRSFKSTDHYGVVLKFNAGWGATWRFQSLLEKDQEYWLDKKFAERVSKLRKLTVTKFQDAEAKASPPPPFITLTLQKAASIVLGFKPDLTMKLAQNLFAAGHITYHRTDNPNLTEETVAEIFKYCNMRNWPTAPKHRKFPSKADAQGAHPAITPKHLEVEEIGDTSDERALYKLIRQRAIASQMADAIFDTRKIEFKSVDDIDGKKMDFTASGRVLKYQGWKMLTAKDAASEDDDEASNPVPKMTVGDVVAADEGELQLKKTEPPKRYTEASLLDALEKSGIGRPSTFAAIIANIRGKGYYEDVKGKSKVKTIMPTPKGEKLVKAMRGKFSFIDYDYTRLMEEDLDKICNGTCDYMKVVTRGYAQIESELLAVGQSITETYASPSGEVHKCPDCGKPMSKRMAAKGPNAGKHFWGCTGYPGCKKVLNHDAERDAPRY